MPTATGSRDPDQRRSPHFQMDGSELCLSVLGWSRGDPGRAGQSGGHCGAIARRWSSWHTRRAELLSSSCPHPPAGTVFSPFSPSEAPTRAHTLLFSVVGAAVTPFCASPEIRAATQIISVSSPKHHRTAGERCWAKNHLRCALCLVFSHPVCTAEQSEKDRRTLFNCPGPAPRGAHCRRQHVKKNTLLYPPAWAQRRARTYCSM